MKIGLARTGRWEGESFERCQPIYKRTKFVAFIEYKYVYFSGYIAKILYIIENILYFAINQMAIGVDTSTG